MSAAFVPQTSHHSCGVEALSISPQRRSDSGSLASTMLTLVGANLQRMHLLLSAQLIRALPFFASSLLATSVSAQVIEFRDSLSGTATPAYSANVIEYRADGGIRNPKSNVSLSNSEPAYVIGGAPNLQAHAARLADQHGIPRSLFAALIAQESRWNPKAISPKGAIGLAQLMPGTARYLRVDPLDPYQNLEGGARYLAEQKRRFGTWRLALAAYNAGPGRVEEYGDIPPFRETQNYVKTILSGWRKNS